MEKQLHFHHNSKFTAMNTLKNYSNASIDDMVFENRNQAYGAYQLRRDSSSRHLAIALFVGILLTSVVTAFSLNNKSVEAIDLNPDVIVDVTEIKVPDLELPKVEAPKPIPQEVIPMATQKFLEFKPVVDDKVIVDDVPTIDDLKGKVISDVTTEGPKVDVPIIKEKVIVSDPVVKPKEVLKFAEQMPEYNGGFLAMQKYLQKNIRYPQAALRMGTTGIVYVEFVIETDGAITDAKVIRGIGDGCDEEALRAVTNMPKWVPGKQNGQEVRVRTTVPIKFELEN